MHSDKTGACEQAIKHLADKAFLIRHAVKDCGAVVLGNRAVKRPFDLHGQVIILCKNLNHL